MLNLFQHGEKHTTFPLYNNFLLKKRRFFSFITGIFQFLSSDALLDKANVCVFCRNQHG